MRWGNGFSVARWWVVIVVGTLWFHCLSLPDFGTAGMWFIASANSGDGDRGRGWRPGGQNDSGDV